MKIVLQLAVVVTTNNAIMVWMLKTKMETSLKSLRLRKLLD